MGKAGEKHRTQPQLREPCPRRCRHLLRGQGHEAGAGCALHFPHCLQPSHLLQGIRKKKNRKKKEWRRIAATSTMISRSSLSSSCKPLLAPPAQTTREQRLQGPSTSGLPGFDVTSSSTFKADLLGPFMKACRLCGKDAHSLLLLSILSFLDSTF